MSEPVQASASPSPATSPVANGFSQATRLLKLSTPLGPDKLLAECVRGEEGLGLGYVFNIAALSLDAAIPLKSLIGQPILLELRTAAGTEDWRPFHGHITAVELAGANGGFARYNLTMQPWTAFLAHGRDSRVFQDLAVPDILEVVFARYQGQGMLAPAWRFDLLDRAAYPKRSICSQYQESDWAFADRLMSEEGLFYYAEHTGDTGSASLGSHTLVIADHNGSFKPNAQASIAYSQPGAVMPQDTMDRWRMQLRQQTNSIELSSWDYRALGQRPISAAGARDGTMALLSRDAPGAYAYPSREHGQRLAERQLQALTAAREVFTGAGTVRTLAPGTTFTLSGQAQTDAAGDGDAATFLVTRTAHLMHNNLDAELGGGLLQRFGKGLLDALIGDEAAGSLHAVGDTIGERPPYRNRIDAIRSKIPYRSSYADDHGQLLHPRPSIMGQQTAIVVGPAGVQLHTDRDHRIKVQFHWQRGTQSHSRLAHPAADGHTGAPGDDSAGTWVRVATPLAPVAGANWGSNALPRVGQEVLVDFLEGNIDRPVVIGTLYNGRGQADAQNNQVSQGTGAATGNAPAWFPGQAGAHAHPAALSGIKTQAMQASQGGGGAYSQLVFDDSPGQGRVALQRHAGPHQGTAELNLGHLRHQSDNQRLAPSGFGAELKTEHSAALRAGAGMLLSAHGRDAGGSQMDAQEALEQLRQSLQLQTSLAEQAQKHFALEMPSPATAGAAAPASAATQDQAETPAPAAQLPALAQMQHSIDVLGATAEGAAAAGQGQQAAGGEGQASAYGDPQLQLSSPSGIAATTPANAVLVAGGNGSLAAGADLNFAAQGNSLYALGKGISLFTYGKTSSKDKPNQETGIRLHAASGKVSSQSQSDATRLTADKAITVSSTAKSVTAAAKQHILMTAQGAYIRLEGGNIMLHGPGKIDFNASMKELTGAASSQPTLPAMPNAADLGRTVELNLHYGDLEPVINSPYKITFANGTSLSGLLNDKGHARLENIPPGAYHIEYGEDQRDWVAPPLVAEPRLQQARQQLKQASALLEAARKSSKPDPQP
ncbi:type VI secretion system Vgr family protein [Janthinobacterium kumbetense]|uniref:Type VI secretion system tip protein VgrG n=1 Tax=Janthinobacterium kumbetense TaxID=2950280 RepID=A0ABT0WZ82_9BURK|nr:type VI secretion system Vgr family protein [Janthinobacterium kumbetense]MCM2569340.1 type VI secretion system tip protein VgrG [Janthinobacterium kumbetense]